MLNSSSLCRVLTLAGGAGRGDVNFSGVHTLAFRGQPPFRQFPKSSGVFRAAVIRGTKTPEVFFQASGVLLAIRVALGVGIPLDEADGLDVADLRISGGQRTAGADRRAEGTELAEADGVAVAGSGDDLGLELVEDGETVGLRHGASGADVLGDRLKGRGTVGAIWI